MHEIATTGDQQIEINKSHIKPHQKTVKPRQYEQQPRKKQSEITACISLEGDVLSYVPLKFPNNQQWKALIDTGAFGNAISEEGYEDLK